MKRLLAFAIPFVIVFIIGSAAYVIVNRDALLAPACETGEPLAVTEVDGLTHTCVTVAGMAHYSAVIKQRQPGSLTTAAGTRYLFPLFMPHDTEGRAIRVLVRTERPPEDLVTFELMTVTGRVRMATPENGIAYDVETIFGSKSDYFFTDETVVLDATGIESGVN